MARGNQREKAREKNLKAQSSQCLTGQVIRAVEFAVYRLYRRSMSYLLELAPRLLLLSEGWTRSSAYRTQLPRTDRCPTDRVKTKNAKTGSEMQRDKEALAALMRQKQEAGKLASLAHNIKVKRLTDSYLYIADAKKTAAAGGSGKK
ncbi:hypothetical protein CHU98_g3148 [Xylaria longipes]|nr:hypothetical protein CHU98_g3148 [Xylaria longipes]